jgi:hypothetical protein
MVAMTRTSGVPRITLGTGIIGHGHAKIAERGHIPWLSLIVGMFACTLCIIKRKRKQKRLKAVHGAKALVCFCSSCPVRVVLFLTIVDPNIWSQSQGWSMASHSRTPIDELGSGRSPLRRPRGGRGGGDRVVVEQVVEKVASAGPVNFPLLTKTNYNDWALLIKIKLKARLLWAAVDSSNVDFHVDHMVLDAICSAVPPELISTLTTKPSAREAWESINIMRVGRD